MEALILDAAPFLTSTLAVEPASLALVLFGGVIFRIRSEGNSTLQHGKQSFTVILLFAWSCTCCEPSSSPLHHWPSPLPRPQSAVLRVALQSVIMTVTVVKTVIASVGCPTEWAACYFSFPLNLLVITWQVVGYCEKFSFKLNED